MAVYEIVKIQRALATNSGVKLEDHPALVYNRDRSTMIEVPMTQELREFMGDAMKVYARVKLFGGQMEIAERVKDQAW